MAELAEELRAQLTEVGAEAEINEERAVKEAEEEGAEEEMAEMVTTQPMTARPNTTELNAAAAPVNETAQVETRVAERSRTY